MYWRLYSLFIITFGANLSYGDCDIYSLTSQGCGSVNHMLSNGSLVLEFPDLDVESIHGLPQSRSCNVIAEISIPKGEKFRPIQAFVDGEVVTSEMGSASIYFSYSWHGETSEQVKYFQPIPK